MTVGRPVFPYKALMEGTFEAVDEELVRMNERIKKLEQQTAKKDGA